MEKLVQASLSLLILWSWIDGEVMSQRASNMLVICGVLGPILVLLISLSWVKFKSRGIPSRSFARFLLISCTFSLVLQALFCLEALVYWCTDYDVALNIAQVLHLT